MTDLPTKRHVIVSASINEKAAPLKCEAALLIFASQTISNKTPRIVCTVPAEALVSNEAATAVLS